MAVAMVLESMRLKLDVFQGGTRHLNGPRRSSYQRYQSRTKSWKQVSERSAWRSGLRGDGLL